MGKCSHVLFDFVLKFCSDSGYKIEINLKQLFVGFYFGSVVFCHGIYYLICMFLISYLSMYHFTSHVCLINLENVHLNTQ